MVVKERMDFNIKIETMKRTFDLDVFGGGGEEKETSFLSIKSVKRCKWPLDKRGRGNPIPQHKHPKKSGIL